MLFFVFLVPLALSVPAFANEASLLGDKIRSNVNDVYITPIKLKKDRNTASTCNEQKDGFQLRGIGISYVKRNPCDSIASPEAPKD